VHDQRVAHDVYVFGVYHHARVQFARALAVVEAQAHLLQLHAEPPAQRFRDALGGEQRERTPPEGQRRVEQIESRGRYSIERRPARVARRNPHVNNPAEQ